MAEVEGRWAQICLSVRQVAMNVSYTGGFLDMLESPAARAIPLPARVLPTILLVFTTGLLYGGINKAISGSAVGNGLTNKISAIKYRNGKAFVSI